MVKCQQCKTDGNKQVMICEEKDTGELLKSGKPKLIRKYFHSDCHVEYLKEKEFKKEELKEWGKVYHYVCKIHNIKALDGRMIERIQDLRNGSIKMKNSRNKIKKYKEGVPYNLILQAYKYSSETIYNATKSMKLDTKWNEFAYGFAIMLNNLDNVEKMQRVVVERNEIESKKVVEVVEINMNKPKIKKKDTMDLSDIL